MSVTLNTGDPIPGSVYFRAVCRVCREPIRVSDQGAARRGLCECGPCLGESGGGCSSRYTHHTSLDGLDADPDAWGKASQNGNEP